MQLKYQIKVGKSDLFIRTKMEGGYMRIDIPLEEYTPKVRSIKPNDKYHESPVFKRNNKRNITPKANKSPKRTRQ